MTAKRGVVPAFLPAGYDSSVSAALRALNAGTAVAGQQQVALRWIIEEAARTYDASYRPGADGDRETAFAEGRRFVGLQIVKVMKLVPASKEGK